jgi:N-acetylmuramoyl-L-alanine amidase
MKNLLKFIGLAFLTITLAFTNVDKRTIVIDVSHGGHDSGVSIEGANEKEIALNIANKIKELNKNSNIEIVLTRDSDKFLTLNERAEFINELNPEFVISIHANSSKKETVNGMEIYISDNNKEKEKSKELASKIKTAFKNQNPEIKKGNFYLLENVAYPIVMLEVGYLTNENDRIQLTSEEGQMKIANTILNMIK